MDAIPAEKLKVLFIAGSGRSGSTILDLMLGQIEGFFSAGELRHVWMRGLVENQLCGCGKPFNECSFWNHVMEEAFGSLRKEDFAAILEAELTLKRIRHIPLLISPWKSDDFRASLGLYSEVWGRLCKAILKVSGRKILVDSSKLPIHGFMLNVMPDVDLYIVHLVRDSRAVAFSWLREKIRPEIHWKQEYMPRFGLSHSAQSWNLTNTLVHILGHINSHYIFLRYEDLVRNPLGVLRSIMAYMRVHAPVEHIFKDTRVIELGSNHTISGNPARFHAGIVHINADVEWQEKMNYGQKAFVTGLTWPLLLKYGYL